MWKYRSNLVIFTKKKNSNIPNLLIVIRPMFLAVSMKVKKKGSGEEVGSAANSAVNRCLILLLSFLPDSSLISVDCWIREGELGAYLACSEFYCYMPIQQGSVLAW